MSRSFLTLAEGYLHLNIITSFSQIPLGHFEPNFVYELSGDREPIIFNISHESKTEGKSEAAIWQCMCLIG